MRAARMHGYKQPLVLEDVKVPDIAADEVLVRVTAAGMCRTDFQLVDGYFKDYHTPTFPITLGHEIAGAVEKIGSLVPKASGLAEAGEMAPAAGIRQATHRFVGMEGGLGSARTVVMQSSSPSLRNTLSAQTKNTT